MSLIYTKVKTMKHTLIVGYGQLGAVLCKQLLKRGHRVTTLSRRPHAALAKQHQHLLVDLDSEENGFAIPEAVDTLCYFSPPSDTDLTDQRLARFLSAQKAPVAHIIYISTSGVYGDSGGELITEESPLNPSSDRAIRRLNAEQQLQQVNQHRSTAITILRCAAIYSEKSINKQRLAANNKPVINVAQAPFTNRIHLTDLTEVCLCAIETKPEQLEIYNVSDGKPTTTTEHAWLLCDLAGLERNHEISIDEAGQYYSPAYMSYLKESKKLDTSKLKKQLKPALKYEDIRLGILDCLKLGD